MATTAYGQTCPSGFKLEQNELGMNCRNMACDWAINLYGEAVDAGQPYTMPIVDIYGMPLPKGKDANGKWVGWSIGAVQCPPDPLNIHPNTEWPCGTDYCPGVPKNIRIANARPI